MDIRTKGFKKRTPVDTALEMLMEKVRPLGTETVLLKEAPGRVTASGIKASMDSPPFDRAAMDGYAVKGENTFGASQSNPIYFRVIGEAGMGEVPDMVVGEFEAVMIMTGGPLPAGANAVVMYEYTTEVTGGIDVQKAVTPGKNVGKKGEDVERGDTLLGKGRALRPQDIGILASMGIGEMEVFKKPKVAIISTGDELLEMGAKPVPGKIYNSNSYSMAAMIELYGGEPLARPIVRDRRDDIVTEIKECIADNDMVVLTGATSVGKKDVIPEIINELGEVLVHGVAMRPGEPMGFGIVEDKPVFMLPGYPVAAMVGFMTFAGPAVQALQGMEPKSPYCTTKAVLKRKIASELGRRDISRVRLKEENGILYAEPVRTSGSGIISSMVRANGFVIVPENTEGLEKGKEVEVHLY